MPSSEPPPSDPSCDTPDDLDQLVKIGVRLARLLERHVEAVVVIAEAHAACELPDPFPLPPLPNYPADIGLTFSRIARAVRLTKSLQARLARPSRPEPSNPPAPKHARDPAAYAAAMRDADGDRIEPPDAVERLTHELWEHLGDDDPDAAILARPLGDILAIIRRDLGLNPETGRREGLPPGRSATTLPRAGGKPLDQNGENFSISACPAGVFCTRLMSPRPP